MSLIPSFREYLTSPIAEEAASALSDGATVQLHIGNQGAGSEESFYFLRKDGKNEVLAGNAPSPEISFYLTLPAAEQILKNPREDIGKTGVAIAKLIISRDPSCKIGLKLHAGFMTLFRKGYFGVVKKGGSAFATFLASRGLSGTKAIKTIITKLKDNS